MTIEALISVCKTWGSIYTTPYLKYATGHPVRSEEVFKVKKLRMMLRKDDEWVHATKEEVANSNFPNLIRRGTSIYINGEWIPVKITLKD